MVLEEEVQRAEEKRFSRVQAIEQSPHGLRTANQAGGDLSGIVRLGELTGGAVRRFGSDDLIDQVLQVGSDGANRTGGDCEQILEPMHRRQPMGRIHVIEQMAVVFGGPNFKSKRCLRENFAREFMVRDIIRGQGEERPEAIAYLIMGAVITLLRG